VAGSFEHGDKPSGSGAIELGSNAHTMCEMAR
jgi:hypothetical protein